MANNVHKNAVASLDPSSTEFPFISLNLSMSIPHSGDAPSSLSKEDGVKTATDFISNRLSLGENDFKVVNSYTDPFGITHVYGTHMLNDVSISNHQAAAHVKNGQVTSFSTSFGTDQHLAKRDLAVSEPKATLSFEQSDGKIVYAYKFQLRDNPVTRWIEVWCDATTGEVIQTVNFAHKASYKVVALPRRDPTEGFSVVANPEFKKPTRRRWTDGKATEGNNAITRDPHGNATRSIRNGVFKTKFNSKEEPSSVANMRPPQ
ncbi:hypothetical protein BASA83_013748 [Batrachochytrium salamandrivorans]|nr:hypothetical protein BASA83_013748 [Batrachochytrium salamandrivorans]